MGEWIRAILDVTLIGLIGTGLVQAARLIRHLATLQESRGDMERFVREFNTAVIRAEAGIKGLRQAARESGDDLEVLVEKAVVSRDELQFLVESADQVAERLSGAASSILRPARDETKPPAQAVSGATPASPPSSIAKPTAGGARASGPDDAKNAPSRAEQELLQALRKLT